jgi:hypothetical protein
MINVRGQVYIRIDIGNQEDVADNGYNVEFVMVEELGNKLPAATLSITYPDELQPIVAHEGTTITVVYGFSVDDSIMTKWKVAGFKRSGGAIIFYLTLDRKYVTTGRYKAFKDKDSISTMKEAVEEYFSFQDRGSTPKETISSIKASNFNDKMTWLQYGWQPIRDFVDHVWLHSYKENQLLIPGITANLYGKPEDKYGTFRLISLGDPNMDPPIEIKLDEDTLVTEKDEGDGPAVDPTPKLNITIEKDVLYSSESALFNYQVGEKWLNSFNIDTSINLVEDLNQITPFFGGKDKEFNGTDIRCMGTSSRYQSDNIHKNYHRASGFNLNRLGKMGGFMKMVVIIDRYPGGIVIGDTIRIQSLLRDSSMVSEVESGDYLVGGTITEVSYNTNAGGYTKGLVLRRDSLDVRKELRGLYALP